MHHEPYDEDGFLSSLEEHVPELIDSLRDALGRCRFLVPIHSRVVGEEKLVAAEDVCSADAQFRTVELSVSLPLETFPTDELIAYTNPAEHTHFGGKTPSETVLRLGELLTSKIVNQQARDFGIFDRLQNKQRHFNFLRSE